VWYGCRGSSWTNRRFVRRNVWIKIVRRTTMLDDREAVFISLFRQSLWYPCWVWTNMIEMSSLTDCTIIYKVHSQHNLKNSTLWYLNQIVVQCNQLPRYGASAQPRQASSWNLWKQRLLYSVGTRVWTKMDPWWPCMIRMDSSKYSVSQKTSPCPPIGRLR